MTQVNNLKKFFVFGIENAEGKTFRGHKEDVYATNIASNAAKFYNKIGFKEVVATNCNDSVFVKDSTGRLLAFVTEVCHLKADGSKEYRTAYWAWNEIKRQAKIIAEKAAVKSSVNSDTEEEVFVRPEGQNKNFYAVISVEYTGFVLKWARCKELTDGKSAKFKGFNGLEQAKAWMRENHAPDASFEHVTDLKQIK